MAPAIPVGISSGLLSPVIALNIWTFVMEIWMYAVRIPAVTKYKVPIHPNMTSEEFNKPFPGPVRWKADNYNHLMEQPTQFYAIALTLAFLGAGDKINVALAWTYVGLRFTHSLVHAISNPIMTRFQIFLSSSVVLAVLTGRAAVLLF
ncbi:hypothetical protein EJ08DRAFT_649241 [Tothia fuscella]|uniref:MAPEG family protein n=1 Tax=Tothia fuscella TaxID=1048955 RepID=A0A9P4NTE6_9PEZI|nr:hypothetical protein EJ08DRAFT_649241 [Tothia fuscella]